MSIWQQVRRSWAEWFPRKYSTTHHLTPVGWYEGEDAPRDRVETWKALHELGPGSRLYVTWWCIWVSPSVSLEERDALRAKCPVGGATRYSLSYIVRVGEPLDRLPMRQPQPATAAPRHTTGPLRPALRIYWLVALVALAALGIVLAAPHLQRSYWDAYLSGKCSASPRPPECPPPWKFILSRRPF